MSLRQGLTAAEETQLKIRVSRGESWASIAERCNVVDDKGREQVPLFHDVNLAHVKKYIYEPLVKALEAAKKAGHETIIDHERAIAAKKAKDAADKKAKEA